MQPIEMRPPYVRREDGSDSIPHLHAGYALKKAKLLTTLLFSQQTTLEEQALPEPTPMTVIGEQLRPRRRSTPSRMIPSKPRMAPKPGSSA